MNNYVNITILDALFLTGFHLSFIMLIIYDIPPTYDPKKPRSPFFAAGSSMYDSIYALQYDYKAIADRFDRENILKNS